MGTIVDKLSKAFESKAAIAEAIRAKGVAVAQADTFASYAGKIAAIEGGGSEDHSTTVLCLGYSGNRGNAAYSVPIDIDGIGLVNGIYFGVNQAFKGLNLFDTSGHRSCDLANSATTDATYYGIPTGCSNRMLGSTPKSGAIFPDAMLATTMTPSGNDTTPCGVRFLGVAAGTYDVDLFGSTNDAALTAAQLASCHYSANGTDYAATEQYKGNTDKWNELHGVTVGEDGVLELKWWNTGSMYYTPRVQVIKIVRTA